MMAPDNFFLIFSPAWMLLSFFAYWPFFFRYIGRGDANKIILLRYYGAFVFGVIPLIITFIAGYDITDVFGLRLNFRSRPLTWLTGLSAGIIIIVINIFITRRKDILEEFPQIRNREWTAGLIVHDSFSWIIYLIGYEMLFRGLMFFPLLELLDFWPAAITVTVIYSLSHYPKSLREAIAAIPFGLFLVFLAWQSHSVWICVWVHACLSVTSSIFSFYHHPAMHLVKSKNNKGKR